MSESRWESVYKNLSRLKCNLRIKYEEWRIAWGRQELNRDKIHYPGCTTQSAKCSHCTSSVNQMISKPDDLLNVFYRNARYAIYKNRETRHPPSLDLFEDLMLDDLRRKYAGKRIEKYKDDLEEQPAIGWFQRKLD